MKQFMKDGRTSEQLRRDIATTELQIRHYGQYPSFAGEIIRWQEQLGYLNQTLSEQLEWLASKN